MIFVVVNLLPLQASWQSLKEVFDLSCVPRFYVVCCFQLYMEQQAE